MPIQLTLEDLGELTLCQGCGKPTYHESSKPENSRWKPGAGDMLPDGLSVSNQRWKVKVKSQILTICANCRFSTYAGY